MIAKSGLRTILGAALAAALCTACANDTSTRNLEVTHDGLERVAKSKVERAWVKPGVDFSQYTEVGLLDCFVSFRRNWKMNHPGVRKRDMERITSGLADEFRQVFTNELENGGYPVVADAAETRAPDSPRDHRPRRRRTPKRTRVAVPIRLRRHPAP